MYDLALKIIIQDYDHWFYLILLVKVHLQLRKQFLLILTLDLNGICDRVTSMDQFVLTLKLQNLRSNYAIVNEPLMRS